MKFADFGVQALVVNALMELEQIAPPYDDGHDWVEAAYNVDWDGAEDLIYGEELYDKLLPAAEAWIKDVDFTPEQLAAITELIWDGGNELYGIACPSWDGETELFTVKSWAEVTVANFPNLQQLGYGACDEPDASVREPLAAAGVEIFDF